MKAVRHLTTLILLMMIPLSAHALTSVDFDAASGCYRTKGNANSTTLSAAITELTWDACLILPRTKGGSASDNWLITGNLTIPDRITLKIEQGVKLNVASGVTVTAPCDKIEAGNYQIFTGDSTNPLDCAGDSNADKIPIQWFGGLGDGTACNSYGGGTDNTAALNRAIAAVPSGQTYPAIYFPTGVYDFATAPTLRASLLLTGPATGSITTGGAVKPCLVFGGSGSFLTFDEASISLSHLAIWGDGNAGTIGIDIQDQRSRLYDVHVANFTGAGSFGIKMAGSAPSTAEANYADWNHLEVNGNQTGILFTGAPTNNNFCYHCTVFGNVSDGVRVEATTQTLWFWGDLEGNCTSAGTCYDLNISAGRWLNFWAWTENADVSKTISLPTSCNPTTTNYISIRGYHSAGNLATSLVNAATNGCSWTLDSPNAYGTDEPVYHSVITAGRIRSYDASQNELAYLVARDHSKGNICTGSQNISTPSVCLKTFVGVEDDATVDLSASMSWTDNVSGEIWLYIGTENEVCRFLVVADDTTRLLEDAGSKCTTTLTTDNKVNIDNNGGALVLENKLGGTRTFSLKFTGAN